MDVASAAPSAPVQLAAVNFAFIAQTNLGNKFQIDTGKLGETHARGTAVRDYATLMDSSHVQVEDNLQALLRKMNQAPAPASLLSSGYRGLVRILAGKEGAAFDHEYVFSQVEYQHANDALYRWEIKNGSNAEIKDYARATLPKIDDHLHRAEALLAAENGTADVR